MPGKTPSFFSIVVAKTAQIDFDTFLKVKKLARAGGGISVLPERKGDFFSEIPSLSLQIIVFHLVPTLNHHDIASKASVTAVSATASGSPCPQCQRVRRPGCTLHTLEWKDRGSFLWFWPRWGSLGGSHFATLGRQDLIFKPCICPYDFRLGLEIQFDYHHHRCWQAKPQVTEDMTNRIAKH